jgi:two-component system OmpR family sensor kinase
MSETTRKILLIEDSHVDALLLTKALQDFKHTPLFELIHVDRLATGTERAKQESFTAVLLDLFLPDAKGVDTLVRMQREAQALPIVVLTGLDDDSTAVEAVRAGAQDYLVKGQIDGRLLVRALKYAIERKRLQEATRLNLDRITALKDVNVALTATLNLSSVLQVFMEKVGLLLPDMAVTVRLWNREQAVLESVASLNFDDRVWQQSVAQPGHLPSFSEIVFQSKQLLLVPDVTQDARVHNLQVWQRQGYRGYLGIPLRVQDEILGVLSFYPRDGSQLISQEVEFLGALASQASAAIRNSQIHGAMSQLASDLERSNRVKEEFLGVISHELRTPLNVVRGYVEILQTGMFGAMNPEQSDAVEKIANQTKVQLTMINSILSATTMESGVALVQTEVVSLTDFLGDLQAAYPSRGDGKVKFDWLYSPALPDVYTDRTKLQYILQNLINNAIKFTPEGVITVAAEFLGAGAAGRDGARAHSMRSVLTLKVSDTGIGIAAEFLPVIFEKFSQVDSSTTRAHEGIGLGLHIVKRCTELLNGSVKVESEEGKGTVFTIAIPCESKADREFLGSTAPAPGVGRAMQAGDEL